MDGEVHVGERAPERAPICPYCHDRLASEETAAWTCPRCGTRHHDGCARENGRCTLLGCGAPHPRPLPGARALVAEPASGVVGVRAPATEPSVFGRVARRASTVVTVAGILAIGYGLVATVLPEVRNLHAEVAAGGSVTLLVGFALVRQFMRYLRMTEDSPARKAATVSTCFASVIGIAVSALLAAVSHAIGPVPFLVVAALTLVGSASAVVLIADPSPPDRDG
jgi:hypothetical protein